jgi:hypothetical protein
VEGAGAGALASGMGGLSMGGGSTGGSGCGGGGGGGLRGRLEAEEAASPGGGSGMAGSPSSGGGIQRTSSGGTWFHSAAAGAAGGSAPRYGGSVPVGGHRLAPAPVHAVAAVVIAGAAPITEHAQLNDRRRVLAKDTTGAITLWDVTKCARIAAFPAAGGGGKEVEAIYFAETFKAQNTVVSIPSWFQIDSRSGSLVGGLYELNPLDPSIACNRLVFKNHCAYRVKTRFQAFAFKWVKLWPLRVGGDADPVQRVQRRGIRL